MGKQLDREKQIQVLRLLSEGNSIRSTMRLTGIEKKTITRIVVRSETLAASSWTTLSPISIWGTSSAMKSGRSLRKNRATCTATNYQQQDRRHLPFTALDTDTKLIASFSVAKRTSEATQAFIADLEKRMVRQPLIDPQSPQISTDGWGPYIPGNRPFLRRIGAARRLDKAIRES